MEVDKLRRLAAIILTSCTINSPKFKEPNAPTTNDLQSTPNCGGDCPGSSQRKRYHRRTCDGWPDLHQVPRHRNAIRRPLYLDGRDSGSVQVHQPLKS